MQTVQEMKKKTCVTKLWNPSYPAWKVLAAKKFTSPTHPTQDDCKMIKEAGHSQSVASRRVRFTSFKIQMPNLCNHLDYAYRVGRTQHFTDTAERGSAVFNDVNLYSHIVSFLGGEKLLFST